jgi:transposase-like protein
MAYLNCPFCPAQAFLVRNKEHTDVPPLEKYRCPSKHVFYVEAEETHEEH